LADLNHKPQLLFVVGPTASGKTALAVEIAERMGAEIISADSVQIYSELKIGSARPSEEELSRVKHHLVGHVSVAADYTAGDFEREAREILARNPTKSYLVVGGSGFYVQALEKGMYPIFKADEGVRNELEARADKLGLEGLHRELEERDPEAARKIAPQDRYRIIRALEILTTLEPGQKLSQVREGFEQARRSKGERFPDRLVRTLTLQLERERLEPRVRLRTRKMLQAGLEAEVGELVGKGFGERPALQSVGYREVLQSRLGTLEESLEEAIVRGTLRLAKKQRTWFGRTDALASSLNSASFDAERDLVAAVNWAISAPAT
jgi:tRNA dimethylallyltransferase